MIIWWNGLSQRERILVGLTIRDDPGQTDIAERRRTLERIDYYHVAGHHDEADDLKIDTHGAPVIAPVFELLREACARFGARPTLLERDFNHPPIGELVAELAQVRAILDAHAPVEARPVPDEARHLPAEARHAHG